MKRRFLAVFVFLGLGILAQAEEVEYTKVGPWTILAITNADGTLNWCCAQFTAGSQGHIRIAVTPDMKKWSMSVPGSGPGGEQSGLYAGCQCRARLDVADCQ